jgi:N-acetylglucosaminyl-diphospho-decaprenol L-rhamnosyltransferase
MSATPEPRVQVVVVTFNSAAHIADCLRSLAGQAGVRARIEVVDNASSDDTVARVRAGFPEASVDAVPHNLGFARANNRALERADAEWVALVNPDTIAPADALATCVRALVARPEVGVVGLRQRDGEGGDHGSAMPFPGLLNLFADTFGLDLLFGWIPLLGPRLSIRRFPGFRPGRITRVDWLQGSFLVVRAAALRAAGPLDAEYFMYGEDVEWCRRIRDAGYAALYLPEPTVLHIGGASAGSAVPALFVESWKGRLRYFRRHRGALATALATGLTAVSILLRATLWEGRARALAATGRPVPDGIALRQRLFRSAVAWVFAGLPLLAMAPAQSGRDSTSA